MKPLRNALLCLLGTVALLVMAACGGSSPSLSGDGPEKGDKGKQEIEISREEILTSLTDLVIVLRYGQAAEAMERFVASSEDLCNNPGDAALDAARNDWRLARDAWTTTEAYRFGPAMDRRSVSLVDWRPVLVERIDRTLDEGKSVTTETVRQFMPSTQRGMGAMEHLLFGEGSDVLASSEGSLRCVYLLALAYVASEEIDGIYQEWRGDGESSGYAGFFNGSAMSSLHARDAEAEVVRSLVFMIRTIANMRLGAALGVDGDPDPVAIPGGMAGHSASDLQRQILGISEMYNGAADVPEALGISHNVRQLSTEVDGRMTAAIEGVAVALGEVDGSLEWAIANEPASVRRVYDSFKELQRVLNTEVVSLLGVSVGFSDTDGDS